MRIVSGQFKGRPLKAPRGDRTRPTTDRVRESTMSAVASARGGFEGAVVLDAFAGSGALGLEALSRGARCAHFYERSDEALRALLGNVRTLGLDEVRARVHRADVLKEPPVWAAEPFDLVFLDPPYALGASEALGVPAALAARGALAKGAFVVYEHAVSTCADADAAADAGGLTLARRKRYGDTVVDVLRFGAQDGAEEREKDGNLL